MSFNLRNAPTYAVTTEPQRINLRNAPVYAVTKDAPGVAVRSLDLSVLETVPPEVMMRSLDALVMEGVVPSSLFSTLNGLETLRAAIKKELGVVVNDALATFGNPLVNTGAYNTRVILTANPASEFGGTVALQYTRFPLSEAFKGKDTSQVVGAATTLHGRLAAINAFYGLKLEPRDVVDRVLVPDTKSFTLRITNDSYLYAPNSTVFIGLLGNDLELEIDNSQMNGFEEINDLESWIKVSEMNGFTPAT
jgi:hypothetical protein